MQVVVVDALRRPVLDERLGLNVYFQVPLRPGTYTVRVQLEDETWVEKTAEIQVGEEQWVNVSLDPP